MINTLSKNEFVDTITELRPNDFTPYALEEMFNWFEQYEEDTGEQIQFDPIAICCEYIQCSLDEINNDYNQEFEDMDDAVEWLNDNSMVIANTDDWVVFQQF